MDIGRQRLDLDRERAVPPNALNECMTTFSRAEAAFVRVRPRDAD
jgi:hypothetical protein